MTGAGLDASEGRRHRHHQPARDDARLGPPHRQADPQRHRLAGPAHRRHLRAPPRRRRREGGHGKDRAGARPLFLRHQDRLDARQRGRRARAAEAGHLAFGTVDTFLIWRLTGGRVHATDATNASRTLLYDIHRNDWDDELLKLLDVPRAMLPEVKDSADDFGTTEPALLGARDRHPRRCRRPAGGDRRPGLLRAGHGEVDLRHRLLRVLNTGAEAVASKNKLLTTIAYRIDGNTTYALEGSIFIAGAAVQWLRDFSEAGDAMSDFILAIDQGTTSTRAIVFEARRCAARRGAAGIRPALSARRLGRARSRRKSGPSPWPSPREVLARLDAPPAAIGITNQRETTLLWDRKTGSRSTTPSSGRTGAAPSLPAPDRRGPRQADPRPHRAGGRSLFLGDQDLLAARQCARRARPRRARRARFRHHRQLPAVAPHRRQGPRHRRDQCRAQLLFDIAKQEWSDELLALFEVPRGVLPEVRDSAGTSALPIRRCSAPPCRSPAWPATSRPRSFGQACFRPGDIKSTYGTGAFIVMNAGDTMPAPADGLLDHRRLASRRQDDLRGGRRHLHRRHGSEVAARRTQADRQRRRDRDPGPRPAQQSRIYFVPAFTGLGAPHWDPDARGAHLRPDSATPAAPRSRAPRWKPPATRPATSSMPCAVAPPLRAIRRCGSMAAWSPTTG